MSDNKFLPLFCVPCFLYYVTIPQWNGCGGCVGLLKSSCPCYCNCFKFCETSNINDWNVSQLQEQGFRSGKVVSTQLSECLIWQAWSCARIALSLHAAYFHFWDSALIAECSITLRYFPLIGEHVKAVSFNSSFFIYPWSLLYFYNSNPKLIIFDGFNLTKKLFSENLLSEAIFQ